MRRLGWRYGTVLARLDRPVRVRVLGEPSGVMVFVGRWACRFSWGTGRFGCLVGSSRWVRFRSRWCSGWHDWTQDADS